MKPRVLLLYYSLTQQTRAVAKAMADSFRESGCEATECPIEFVDQRYRMTFPWPSFWPTLLRWILPQALRRTGAVRVPEGILDKDYDLVCIGSPTWWWNPAMPVNSFLRSDAAKQLLNGKKAAVFVVCRAIWWNNLRLVKKMITKNGGKFVDGAAFRFVGNDVQSFLTFINYMTTATNRDRLYGIRLYEFGIPTEGLARAKTFARSLVDSHLQSAAREAAALTPEN